MHIDLKGGMNMAINVDKLNEKINHNNLTLGGLADTVGINRSTFYRKVKGGGGGFVLWEIKSLIVHLKLSKEETYEIFLA